MASNNLTTTRKHLLEVKSYSIDQAQVLGQGAFGIVYKGNDTKKNTIAAKRIDGNVHPRILTQDLDRFLHLDHPNVIKILDVEKSENIIWMMMPFCEFDLNKFYKTKDVSQEKNFDVMIQIMKGIEYLHRQDIVHRDIKPGNILVVSENPLKLLLADFDVCKCLDPEVETSLMTSNVGTLAFKAPEFFQRTSPGKIEYHRNVDIYAAGLTFLAILQAEQGKKMLIPHIETPRENSELHVPSIGQLIAERIKYKVPELHVVEDQGALAGLIRRMTWVNPRQRLSAVKVLNILDNLRRTGSGVPDLGPEVPKIKLSRAETFKLSAFHEIVVNDMNHVFVHSATNGGNNIRVLSRHNGNVGQHMFSRCNHKGVCLIAHPTRAGFVLEGCDSCEDIRSYNISAREFDTVIVGSKPTKMCHGPAGSILVLSKKHNKCDTMELSRLNWDDEQHILVSAQTWEIVSAQTEEMKKKIGMCYVERHDILAYVCKNERVEAVRLGKEKCVIWSLSGLPIKPDSITSDTDGNAYVGDGTNNRIIKIDSFTGDVITVLQLGEESQMQIRSLFWTKNKPSLTVARGDKISTFYIPQLV